MKPAVVLIPVASAPFVAVLSLEKTYNVKGALLCGDARCLKRVVIFSEMYSNQEKYIYLKRISNE